MEIPDIERCLNATLVIKRSWNTIEKTDNTVDMSTSTSAGSECSLFCQ